MITVVCFVLIIDSCLKQVINYIGSLDQNITNTHRPRQIDTHS